MFTFTYFLAGLQAAIAVASARDRGMSMFFVGLWNRVGRMGRRLEKLIALWQAGMLPKARVRESEAGARLDRVRTEHVSAPNARGWLHPRMAGAGQCAAMLETLLTQEECVRFLAEVPQARKIVGVLVRMLIVPPGKPVPTMKRALVWPPPAWQEAVRQAGMHIGPTGRIEWN